MVVAQRGGGNIFIGDVTYIHWFHVTNEYIPIFLVTEEYKELYS
jgi:hypothetical protein